MYQVSTIADPNTYCKKYNDYIDKKSLSSSNGLPTQTSGVLSQKAYVSLERSIQRMSPDITQAY